MSSKVEQAFQASRDGDIPQLQEAMSGDGAVQVDERSEQSAQG